MTDVQARQWVTVAALTDLDIDRGMAARLGSHQIALFCCEVDGEKVVYAIDNLDPFSGANVLARGVVGDRGGELKVASPIYKQQFSLLTGRCFDDPNVTVPTHRARIAGGFVEVECPT
jgi:nitrite reductase (NADH) small subunit